MPDGATNNTTPYDTDMSTTALNACDFNPVTPAELVELATITLAHNKAILHIGGKGGGGKTSIASHAIPKALGMPLYGDRVINLSGMGPNEVLGYGIPNAATGDMRFAAPDIWPTHERVGDDPYLIVLDEFNDYDPQVRALLRGLYPASGARFVGPHRLGRNVRVIATGNRRSDGTRSAIEEAPFTERCVKCTLVSNLGDWLDWVDTQDELLDSGTHVPAFLKYGNTTGEGVNHFSPPIKLPFDGAPHPCERSWETVMRAEPFRTTNRNAYKQLVKGAVGDAAAHAYMAFLSHVDSLPDLASLRSNYTTFKVPTEVSQQFALVSAALAVATRGVKDVAIAVHSGGFDWLVHLLLGCRGDVREYGARAAVRRRIPLDEHPKSNQLIIA